jgi:anti-sigma factor RsiW
MQQECRHIRDNLAAFLDSQVSQEERLAIQMHLSLCPSCQTEAQSQTAIKGKLRHLKRVSVDYNPPAHVWNNAVKAWKRHDLARRTRYQLRFALAGAAVLMLAMTVVWARLAITHEFPVERVLQDFRTLQAQKHIAPALQTSDADRAARWLRDQMRAEIPPLNLSLSKAQLIGADALEGNPAIGRLIYRTKRGLIAIYVAPRGGKFSTLTAQDIEGRSFFVEASAKNAGLYGWQKGSTGFALVCVQPLENGQTFVLDARRATDSQAR